MKSLRVLVALFALTFITSSSFAQGSKVAISDLSWNGAKAIGHIIRAIITGPMGLEADIVDGLSDQGVVMAGMDKGDGSADVYTDLWMPNQQEKWDRYIRDAGTVATNKPYLGTQLMYVPTYMSDRVRSFDDLKDPEIAALFDKDGNGKGEYWAGDAGWNSTKTWQVKMKSYGLSDLWEPEIVPQDTFKAQLKAAYGNQKPILFYYWTPEAIHASYDLTALDETPYSDGCLDMHLDKEDWLEISEAPCRMPDAMIYVAYSKSLEQRNPAVAKFLSQIQLEGDTVNNWILQIFELEKDPQDVAEAWISENRDLVNSWIN